MVTDIVKGVNLTVRDGLLSNIMCVQCKTVNRCCTHLLMKKTLFLAVQIHTARTDFLNLKTVGFVCLFLKCILIMCNNKAVKSPEKQPFLNAKKHESLPF